MGRITLKRQYTSAHPSKKVNAQARVRNQVIEYVARNKKVTKSQLESFLKDVCKSEAAAKKWMKSKGSLFSIAEDVVSLSKKGLRIYDSVMNTGKKLNESETFLSFEEFSGLSDADKKEEDDDSDEDEDDEDFETEEEKEGKPKKKKKEKEEDDSDDDSDDDDSDEDEDDEDEDVDEAKMKGKDPCWDGYKMVGKKKKNGKEVPNCVPENSEEDEDEDELSEEVSHEEDLQILEAREGVNEVTNIEVPQTRIEASNMMFSAFVKYRQYLQNAGLDKKEIMKFKKIRKMFEDWEDSVDSTLQSLETK